MRCVAFVSSSTYESAHPQAKLLIPSLPPSLLPSHLIPGFLYQFSSPLSPLVAIHDFVAAKLGFPFRFSLPPSLPPFLSPSLTKETNIGLV